MKLRWSFSHSRTFGRCPRQWFFATQLSRWNARDPLGREAFLLSKLQSVSAWRGSLVDAIICDEIIPAFRTGLDIDRARVISLAKERFHNQLDFARERRWREPGMSVTEGKNSYAALFGFEYDQDIEAELAPAWTDVEQALTNFLEMSDLLKILREASQLIPQRTLKFRHSGASVTARPDLIAFFKNAPPLIVDWKVHTFAAKDYRLQLALYALALTRCRPHRDFPLGVNKYPAHEIVLLEAQLLTEKPRDYHLTVKDIENAENYISVTATQMSLALRAGLDGPITHNDMAVTIFPDTCQRCSFRSICWEDLPAKKENLCLDLKQTSFLS